MKIIDYINASINTYPSLYMLEDYEDSAFAVLHHTFVVLGNGIEWADTGDPLTGGYLVNPQYKDGSDGWVRIKDKIYGEEKHELDPKIFNERLYYVREIDAENSSKLFLTIKYDVEYSKAVFESELEALKKQYNICNGRADYIPNFHTHRCMWVGKYLPKDNPYPNFQKKYSCFWEIEPELIKEDWKLAGIEHLRYWQEYFNDDERIKSYHYYKNPKTLEEYITKHYKNSPGEYPDWIQDVRDGYETQEFNGENFEEFAELRWEKELKKTKEFISETLERLEK